MPPFPNRTTMIIVSTGAALLALAILVGRGDGPDGVLIEPRPAPPGVDEIRVDVGGEVVTPGVYVLDIGARVSDAIEAAGGATADGDLVPLNLARRVADEDRIRVPRRGEEHPLLDLNSASRAQLEALPGIGPARAAAIIEARSERPFASSDELQTRGLVPASVYVEIRDLVATPATRAESR